jgi:hypothetical protein
MNKIAANTHRKTRPYTPKENFLRTLLESL